MKSISNEIKYSRNRLGLTQQDVAKKLNVSYATYNQYENNPLSMELGKFIRLCEILQNNLLEIFFTHELYKMYKNNINQKEN